MRKKEETAYKLPKAYRRYDDDLVTVEEFIYDTIRYLQHQGKDIRILKPILDEPEFYSLVIKGKTCRGLWGSLGLAAILHQYRDEPDESYLLHFGLPATL